MAVCSIALSQMSTSLLGISNCSSNVTKLGPLFSSKGSSERISSPFQQFSSSLVSPLPYSTSMELSMKTPANILSSNVAHSWTTGCANLKFSVSSGTHSPISKGRDPTCNAQIESVPPMSEAEKEGWEQRKTEAAETKDASPFTWQWTLNWDTITPNILVGSCPRSPSDIDRLVDEAGIDAVLNLQSDLCFEALKIPFEDIRNRAVERGLLLERVAIRDFDHGDQSLMLPVAVRLLNMLLARGMKVYVHCTAGINRATLTTVGYLTFVQGMELDDAVREVKSARSVAHPYIDCWSEVRRRLLDGRSDEISATSENIYETRCENGTQGTSDSDWGQAEKLVISRTFQRWLETDLATIDMETAWLKRKFELGHKGAGGNGILH